MGDEPDRFPQAGAMASCQVLREKVPAWQNLFGRSRPGAGRPERLKARGEATVRFCQKEGKRVGAVK